MVDPDQLQARLAPYGQEHLLRFWDELEPERRQALAADIGSVDLEMITRLHREGASQEDWAGMARRSQPPPAIRLDPTHNRFAADDAYRRGQEALRAGHVGAILVAGGQGTRLGFDAPKGTLRIGPVSHHSLFQILLEKIVAAGRRYGVRVPLYLMTSPATHEATVAYLRAHDRFGLAEEDLTIFCQGTLPAIDAQTGRLLLADRDKLFRNPDGHGGMLAAFERSGALAACRSRGIRQLFYFQVDNPLVTMCDERFIGYHLLAESEMTTQVIAKQTPLDRVGNFVLVDGQARIIEYSDLPADVGQWRNPDGSLTVWAGSIAVHVFEVDFLARVARDAAGLPLHRARKKVPYLGHDGRRVEPTTENAIKFERFIFDLLPLARRPLAVEVDERDVFAPVKNASGDKRDTPESVQAQMIDLHTRWLQSAGGQVKPGTRVEISPLFATDVEELREKVSPGTRIERDTYFA